MVVRVTFVMNKVEGMFGLAVMEGCGRKGGGLEGRNKSVDGAISAPS
jgi:hypothetical protein